MNAKSKLNRVCKVPAKGAIIAKGHVRTAEKALYYCKNGPMNNKLLYLTTPNTLVFTMNGVTGRYVSAMLGNTLIWEEL